MMGRHTPDLVVYAKRGDFLKVYGNTFFSAARVANLNCEEIGTNLRYRSEVLCATRKCHTNAVARPAQTDFFAYDLLESVLEGFLEFFHGLLSVYCFGTPRLPFESQPVRQSADYWLV